MPWRHVHVYHIQLRRTDDIRIRHVLMYKTSQRVQSLSLYTVLNLQRKAAILRLLASTRNMSAFNNSRGKNVIFWCFLLYFVDTS
jgi:hypothetical protein